MTRSGTAIGTVFTDQQSATATQLTDSVHTLFVHCRDADATCLHNRLIQSGE
jgi:hypothetical protein